MSEELAKALLGFKFKCSVCGSVHDPEKRAWRKCEDIARQKIIKIPQLVRFPTKMLIRKGEKNIEKIEKKYRRSSFLNIYQSPFEFVTIPDVVLEKAQRLSQWVEAENKVIIEAVEKLPDIPIRVTRVERETKYHSIKTICVNGVPYSDSQILTLFKPPIESWSYTYMDGKTFHAVNHSIYMVSDDLKYIVVQQRQSAYRGGELKSLVKNYYLVGINGECVELPISVRHTLTGSIEEIIKKYGVGKCG